MLSTSREHLKWAVVLAGHRHVVEVDWPGFDNKIAVDGVVAERWSWPGNNLYATRSFHLDGVSCTVVRRRVGLLDYSFKLRIEASGAVIEEIDAVGVAGEWHPTRSALLLGMVLVLLAGLSVCGIVAYWVAAF